MVAEATGALEWLEEKQKLQNSLRHTDDPVLLASDIAKREGTLVRFADPILNKPAPPPPKVGLPVISHSLVAVVCTLL